MSVDTYVRILEPIPITDARLISSNIPEDDYAAWSSSPNYSIGDRVIVIATHKIYESLTNNNHNHPPATSPTEWVEVSATNRWKVFDNSNSTQTVAVGSPREITYTLRMNKIITCVGVLNVTEGYDVRIQVDDPDDGIVYDETHSFSTLTSSSWWAWFFGERVSLKTQIIDLNIPAYIDADIIITITGGANLAVGVIVLGAAETFGLGVNHGARIGIQDYSRKETNEFGDTILVERAFAKRIAFDMLIDKHEVDALQRFLSKIRAKPCLWIVNTDYEALSLFGIYKQFDVLISYPEQSQCQIELEGLA